MKVGSLVMENGTTWIGVIVTTNHTMGLYRVLWFNNNKESWTSHPRIKAVKKCP